VIARLLAVRPGEGPVVARLGGHFFLILAATTLYSVAAEGLFLASYDPSLLPYVYLGGALLGAGAALLRDRLGPRISSRVLTISLALLLVALRLGLLVLAEAGPFVFLLLAQTCGVLLGIENASLLARALDARSARRLLPAIGALGGLGPIAAGLCVAALAPRLGASEMAWPAAALVCASLLLLDTRSRRTSSPGATAPIGAVVRQRFALLLLAFVLLAGLLSTMMRFQLGVSLSETRLPPGRIAGLLGLLGAGLSAGAVLFQLTAARAILGRFGVGWSLVVYPIVLLVAGCSAAFLPGLGSAALAFSLERLLRLNLVRPVLLVAVMPLPDAVRGQTTSLVRGALEPMAVGLASVLLVSAGRWPGLVWGVPVVAALSLACAWGARRLYSREVMSALHSRRLRLAEGYEEPEGLEAGVRRLLHEQLASGLPVRTSLALQLLEGQGTAETVEHVRSHWSRWDPWVKGEAVRSLMREPVPEAIRFLRSLPAGESSSVRAGLLRFGAVSPKPEELTSMLEDPELEIRREALARLLERNGPHAARSILDEWIRSDRSDLRGAAAYVIGCSEDEGLRDDLSRLGPSVEVAEALARRPTPRLAELAVRCLLDDRAYPAAREALLGMGGEARSALRNAARDPERSAPAIRVLGEMRDPGVLELLEDPDEEIRYRAAKSWLPRGAETNEERRLVRRALESELARPPSRDFEWAVDRILTLLALLYPNRSFRRISLSWADPEAKQRAFALEALDESLPGEWRGTVLPFLERRPDVPEPPQSGLRATSLFREWRARDFELVMAASLDRSRKGSWIRFEAGEPTNLPAAILGESATVREDETAVSLEGVYRAIGRRPRAAAVWLRALALRCGGRSPEELEASRAFVSLGSKAVPHAASGAGDLTLWQRIFFLRAVRLFSDLDSERLRLLAEIVRPVSAETGEIVVREGRPGHHFYVVCSGFVEVGSAGRQVAVLGAGETFGELALLTGEPRSATVRAVKQSELLTMDRTDFLDLIEAHPTLVPAVSEMIIRRTAGDSPSRESSAKGDPRSA